MNDIEPVIAKATTPEEQSDGIVVSFAAEWHQPLLGKKFTAVIRKRVPKTVKSRWLYFHINAPVCAICGRAEICSIDDIDLKEAQLLSKELALQPAEITAYFGGDKTVGCYRLGHIALTNNELSKQTLSSRLTYHPPQSFFILSHAAKKIIDSLAGFHGRTKE
ncbi:MAG: hypothetical protein KJ070_01135 [Verrucomicrobia bacterium]|nr:hypothetical protein [Verrucomicrobiota bacterium]